MLDLLHIPCFLDESVSLHVDNQDVDSGGKKGKDPEQRNQHQQWWATHHLRLEPPVPKC